MLPCPGKNHPDALNAPGRIGGEYMRDGFASGMAR